jgi:hypothetical protein
MMVRDTGETAKTAESASQLTIPLHRNEVKLLVRCRGYLRPVSGNVIQLRVPVRCCRELIRLCNY